MFSYCVSLCNNSFFSDNSQLYCPVIFDGYACWPQTPAGSNSVQPCPAFITGFDPKLYAHKKWVTSIRIRDSIGMEKRGPSQSNIILLWNAIPCRRLRVLVACGWRCVLCKMHEPVHKERKSIISIGEYLNNNTQLFSTPAIPSCGARYLRFENTSIRIHPQSNH